MGFRLVPKSLTLNGIMANILPNSVAFVANYVHVVDWPSTDFLLK